jgi:hypothetical protein
MATNEARKFGQDVVERTPVFVFGAFVDDVVRGDFTFRETTQAMFSDTTTSHDNSSSLLVDDICAHHNISDRTKTRTELLTYDDARSTTETECPDERQDFEDERDIGSRNSTTTTTTRSRTYDEWDDDVQCSQTRETDCDNETRTGNEDDDDSDDDDDDDDESDIRSNSISSSNSSDEWDEDHDVQYTYSETTVHQPEPTTEFLKKYYSKKHKQDFAGSQVSISQASTSFYTLGSVSNSDNESDCSDGDGESYIYGIDPHNQRKQKERKTTMIKVSSLMKLTKAQEPKTKSRIKTISNLKKVVDSSKECETGSDNANSEEQSENSKRKKWSPWSQEKSSDIKISSLVKKMSKLQARDMTKINKSAVIKNIKDVKRAKTGPSTALTAAAGKRVGNKK